MALHRCPDCRKKISEHAEICVHCGFSFKAENLALFKQKMEQRRLENAEINRKSTKIHLFWLAIFSLVIAISAWWNN